MAAQSAEDVIASVRDTSSALKPLYSEPFAGWTVHLSLCYVMLLSFGGAFLLELVESLSLNKTSSYSIARPLAAT